MKTETQFNDFHGFIQFSDVFNIIISRIEMLITCEKINLPILSTWVNDKESTAL